MDISIEEIVGFLSPAGRVEWELALTKALLHRSETERTKLMELLESQTRDQKGDSVEAS